MSSGRPGPWGLVGCLLAALTLSPAVLATSADVATADLVKRLEAEIARLEARVSQLESVLGTGSPAPVAGEPVTVAGPPGPARSTSRAAPAPRTASVLAPAPAPRRPPAATASRPGAASRAVEAGGRIKLDIIANSASAGAGVDDDGVLRPGSIALDDRGEEAQLLASARASRLWLKAREVTPLGDAAAYLEVDFLGGGGNERVASGYAARLRHAYAELGPWLFGQTHSTFMHVAAFPEHNDDGTPAGAINVRQAQARYSRPLGAGTLALALESPETTLLAADGRREAPDDDRLPDAVLRYEWRGTWGSLALAGLLRELRQDDGTTRSTATGYGASVGGRLVLGARDGLRFMGSGGAGIGRYLGANAFDDAWQRPDGGLDAGAASGGFLSWQHLWSARWRSNLTAGAAWWFDGAASGSGNRRIASAHANLLWSPLATTTLGLEWTSAMRQRQDGASGALHRLQLSALYKF